MQLMQVYSQKSIRTTFPRRPDIVRGEELIQTTRGPIAPTSGAVSDPGWGGRIPAAPPCAEGGGIEGDEEKERGIGLGNSGARSCILINAEESNPCGQTATGFEIIPRTQDISTKKTLRVFKLPSPDNFVLYSDKNSSSLFSTPVKITKRPSEISSFVLWLPSVCFPR